jgi:flagellar biosynthetic protein FlhB
VAGEKTEKATPKKREEARKKGGGVARSQDLTGAVVMLVGLTAIHAFGGKLVAHCRETMDWTLHLIAHPDVVSARGLPWVIMTVLQHVALAILPIVGACAIAAIVVNVAMVRPKLSMHGLRMDAKRLNPVTGFKNIYGPNSLFEGGKSILKLLAVGTIVAIALIPMIPSLGGMIGMTPQQLCSAIVGDIYGIGMRAAVAYLLIGIIDIVYQRYRTEKSMKMDKQEVKEEAKQQALPAEVRGAMRRRQMQNSRARMMAAVPEADVVVTNPTHYAVALKYDGSNPAPEVVAKGVDLVAARIRELATDAGVPIVPDPPLARALHASVEVGHQIPEELFGAVAQILAFVYRMAGKRQRAAA